MLTSSEKKFIQLETGWTHAIVDSIHSMKEYQLYRILELSEIDIDGRPCLIPTTSPSQESLDRMHQGKAWLDTSGKPLELHHLGSTMASAFVVLPREYHRGKGYFTILHPNFWKTNSSINRAIFARQRRAFWRALARRF